MRVITNPAFAIPFPPVVSAALKQLTARICTIIGLPFTKSARGENPVAFAFSFLTCYTCLRSRIWGWRAANRSVDACIIHASEKTSMIDE